ncbi:hypothetical protein [Spirosoma agri]|uniref:RHS repeat protein n=1 Tax=Spirosoma agri TaxID=1987381 RepID=A0A6M0IR17_9BACT|nr:hypothetical protein [Spirosoma agri]NEU70770.1 hypothetical protein [Spirosoma agri]
MKTTPFTPCLLLICLMVSLLNSRCSPPADGVDSGQNTCRIQQIVSTVKNANTEGTSQTQYAYDAADNLLRITKTSRYQSGTMASQSSATTETFSYDANNFLIRKQLLTQDQSIVANRTTDYQYAATTEYTYSNGRLVSYQLTDLTSSTTNSGTQQQRNVSHCQYDYDASGQLVRQTVDQNQPITYQNGLMTSYSSNPNQFTVTNGLITKAFFPGTEGPANTVHNLTQLRQYDEQRRPIEHRELINDTVSSYYTQTWQAGLTAEQSLPAFKGHPRTRPPYGEPGLATDYRQFQINRQQNNTVYQSNRTTTVHVLNDQGYVTRSTATTTNSASGTQQPDVMITVYTYTKCN